MKLLIIIPCLNEEKTIGTVIQSVPPKIAGIKETEILIIDDGSNDNTVDIAQKNGAKVISHHENSGVGVAFQTGIKHAISSGFDIIVNMDGDGQFDPKDIEKLIKPVLENQADFVSASRFKNKDFHPQMSKIKKWGNFGIAALISFLVGERFHDVSCGFRAYSIETVLNLNLFGKFTYTQESFLDLAFKDIRILEVPLKIKGTREFGKSRVANNLWRYAVNTSKIIFRTYRDYKPLQFFGSFSAVFFVFGTAFGVFFGLHYYFAGMFSPHLWAGFLSGFSLTISFLLFITGMLADMIARLRKNQEKILYFERKKTWEKNRSIKNSMK